MGLAVVTIALAWSAALGGGVGIAAAAEGPTLRSPALDRGAVLFETHCAGCHAQGGNIIRRGKSLKQRALERYHLDTQEAIAALVAQGKMPMSGYADRLSPDEINAVAAYVLQQAAAGWPS
jgi:cytochrome c6